MKSLILVDRKWMSLTERIEGMLELYSKEHNIVGLISAQREGIFFASIFYEVKSPTKEPAVAAKVLPIDGCRFHSSPGITVKDHTGKTIEVECAACYDEEGSYTCVRSAHKIMPGGCVSVPDGPAIENHAVPVISSITPTESEKAQAELEPLPSGQPGRYHVG